MIETILFPVSIVCNAICVFCLIMSYLSFQEEKLKLMRGFNEEMEKVTVAYIESMLSVSRAFNEETEKFRKNEGGKS
jgi:hypothetical protein